MYDYCMIIIIDFKNEIYVKNTSMTNLETYITECQLMSG